MRARERERERILLITPSSIALLIRHSIRQTHRFPTWLCCKWWLYVCQPSTFYIFFLFFFRFSASLVDDKSGKKAMVGFVLTFLGKLSTIIGYRIFRMYPWTLVYILPLVKFFSLSFQLITLFLQFQFYSIGGKILLV